MNQNNVRIKVCGMREEMNIKSLTMQPIDYIGFIFYAKSPRYVSEESYEMIKSLVCCCKKTGVFVNENFETIRSIVAACGLDAVQLHGNESPQFCNTVRSLGVEVFKVFSIDKPSDLLLCSDYTDVADLFLFDTKCAGHGGSGMKFDWSILDNYIGQVPFLLSGGIGPEDYESLLAYKHPKLYGVDLNSKFEIAPAFKDIETLSSFIHKLRHNE